MSAWQALTANCKKQDCFAARTYRHYGIQGEANCWTCINWSAAKKNGHTPIIARIAIGWIVSQFDTQMEINLAYWSVNAEKMAAGSAESKVSQNNLKKRPPVVTCINWCYSSSLNIFHCLPGVAEYFLYKNYLSILLPINHMSYYCCENIPCSGQAHEKWSYMHLRCDNGWYKDIVPFPMFGLRQVPTLSSL